MVTPVFATALSGLNAAATRLANSAHNIANIHSTGKIVRGERIQEPYTPTDVVQSSIEPVGGVRADIRERDTASIEVYAPDHPDADSDGIVKFPNVSLDEEIIQQKLASYDYKANLKVFKTQDEMLKNVLDIES